MVLAAGTRLGPYEILSALGAGGMGEVYKAKDTRLDRMVAIKILSPTLAADSQFRERFDREARAISQLDHPHICALHDVGEQDGTAFLIMQYLEGETLAARLERGALPLDHALQLAIHIADALDKAHRAGITHRDLKPANIMLTKAGAKLLDFGLAKTDAPLGAGSSMLPTTPPDLTVEGAILGTFPYMAPEQLEGHAADARTDIFAFGAVVYEMLTGKKAFEGKNQASLIGAILKDDPPRIAMSQPLASPALDRIVRTCLAKDPDDRWQSARDLLRELTWSAGESDANAVAAAAGPRRSARNAVVWTAAVAAGLLVAFVVLLKVRADGTVQEPHAARFSILPPEHTSFLGGRATPYLAMSPDGRRLAFVPAAIGGRTLLWIRSLDSLAAGPLAGTDGATYPFWSPDGRFIAFFADGKLKVIDSRGGAPHPICDAPAARGGAWSRDGVIVFTPQNVGPLFRVPAIGGQPIAVTALDASRQEVNHKFPSFLPDGRHFMFFAQSGKTETSAVRVGSIDTKETRLLDILGSKAAYAAGFVLFGRDQSLMTQAFDASRLELSGEPVSLGDQVAYRSTVVGDASFSVADDGTLAYWSGEQAITNLMWLDRRGQSLGTVGTADRHNSLALSPDERQVAVEIPDPGAQTANIWVIDVATGIKARVTSGSSNNWGPLWSPDGARLVFGSLRAGPSNLYRKAATGGGAEELVLKSPDFLGATDWSADGRFIVLLNLTKFKVGVLPLTGDRTPKLVSETEFVEGDGRLSPDGRWLAYTSNESGSWDVYVRPFPALDRKWRISPDGGSGPRWRSDGRELFYIGPDQKLTAASVIGNSSFAVSTPTALFQLRTIPVPPGIDSRQQYAVAAHGDRFLVNTVVELPAPSPITVVLNWREELKKQRVPTR